MTLCEEPFGKDDAAGVAKLNALQVALRPGLCSSTLIRAL